jgi:hypothetical protein
MKSPIRQDIARSNEFTRENTRADRNGACKQVPIPFARPIFSLVTVEQLLKPAEIAARSCLNKRSVLRDIRDGKFGDYYCRAENSIAVPASGVNEWRNNFRVPAKPKQELRR